MYSLYFISYKNTVEVLTDMLLLDNEELNKYPDILHKKVSDPSIRGRLE